MKYLGEVSRFLSVVVAICATGLVANKYLEDNTGLAAMMIFTMFVIFYMMMTIIEYEIKYVPENR